MFTAAQQLERTGRIAEGFTRLAPLGLTAAQARLLRTIAASERPPRMSDIAAELGIAPRSATATVEALEAAGLVDRVPDTRDRRSVLVELTADADPLVRRILDARHEAADEVFCTLDTGERSTLLDLLDRLVTHDNGTVAPEAFR
jgi:DNA-binding MarR family transcriptional regulator